MKEVVFEPGLESYVKVHFWPCFDDTEGWAVVWTGWLHHRSKGDYGGSTHPHALDTSHPFPCLILAVLLLLPASLSIILHCLAPSPLLAPTHSQDFPSPVA